MPSAPTSTKPSRLRRLSAMVTAGAETSSQCASSGGNDLTAFGLGFENGLEVVFLRDVDCVFHDLSREVLFQV